MKIIPTTSNYRSAFWNNMRNQPFNKVNLETARNSKDGSLHLPSEDSENFRKYQAVTNIFRTLSHVENIDSAASVVKWIPPIGAAEFVESGAEIPGFDAATQIWNLKLHKIAKLVKVSVEMANDAGFDIEDALALDFGRSFGRVEESGCINGDGITAPYGILHDVKGAKTGATSAAAGAIKYDDIKALYLTLDVEYRRNAVWFMSDETALLLRTLKDDAGNSLWNDVNDTVFGKPVYTSPYMPSVTSGSKPVLFGDFNYFWLVERGGITLLSLRERYAADGIIGYIGTEHIDGGLTDRSAVKALVVA